jgi:hypothetical protein
MNHSYALKFSGTVLTLPARYNLRPPTNSRGFGSWSSLWNFHLLSLMSIGLPLFACVKATLLLARLLFGVADND